MKPVEAKAVMLSRQVPLLAVQLVPPDATASGTWHPQPLAVLLTSVAFAVLQKPTENRFGTSTSNGIASDGPDVGAMRPTTVNAGKVCGNGTCAPASAATKAMKNAMGIVSLRIAHLDERVAGGLGGDGEPAGPRGPACGTAGLERSSDAAGVRSVGVAPISYPTGATARARPPLPRR